MTMTTQPLRIARSFEPTAYLELAGRIDWLESGSGTGADDAAGSRYEPSAPYGTDLAWAA